MQDEIGALEAAWCASPAAAQPIHWGPEESLVAHLPLDGQTKELVGGNEGEADGAVSFATGTVQSAGVFDGTMAIKAGDVADFGFFDKFTIAAWILPQSDSGTLVARMAEHADADGYLVQLAGGKLQVNLVKRWLDDAVRVETDESLPMDRWQHVAVTYDGSRVRRRHPRLCRWPRAEAQGPARRVEPVVQRQRAAARRRRRTRPARSRA